MAADGSMRSAVARCLSLARHHAGQGESERARGMMGLALDLAAPNEVAAVISAAAGVLTEIGARPRPDAQPDNALVPASDFPVEGAGASPAEVETPAREPPPQPVRQSAPRPVRPAAPPAPPAPRRKRSLFRAGPVLATLAVSAVMWTGVTVFLSAPSGDAGTLLSRGRAALAEGDTAAAVRSLSAATRAAGDTESAERAAQLLRSLQR